MAKTVGGATTHFLYDLSGRLIGEADGATTAEYIWLEGMPLAFIQGGAIYYIHADHLGTPQRLTDATKAVVWDASYAPFGQATVSSSLTFNLRFPGQYRDVETGLHYNTFRDYDPALGRYAQSDPIGLTAGWNVFAYVQGNPVMRADPMGLIAAGAIMEPPPNTETPLCETGFPDCGPPPRLPNYSNADEFPMGPEHGLRFGFGCPQTDGDRVLVDFRATWKKLDGGNYECLNIICLYSRCENGVWRDTDTKIKACGRGLVQR